MATFKNTTENQVDIPALDLHVAAGETFEVPDEFAAQFEANPDFGSSRVKHPDVSPEPGLAEAVTAVQTGPVPVQPAAI